LSGGRIGVLSRSVLYIAWFNSGVVALISGG
jgi:hypothetical protein